MHYCSNSKCEYSNVFVPIFTGYVGEQTAISGKIKAISKTGKIQLFYQDWFASLNLVKDPYL